MGIRRLIRPAARLLLELELLEQEVRHQPPQAGIFELQLGHAFAMVPPRSSFLRRHRGALSMGLSPAVESHHADLQGTRNVALGSSLLGHDIRLRKLGGDLSV
jgi:hypothetical protein